MITKFEEDIYNTFLRESRKNKNKPFKYRKDFSKMNDTNILYLKRLSNLFNNHTEIVLDEFFSAPYNIYQDEYFDLKFYTTQKAITVWKMHMKQKNSENSLQKDTTSCINKDVENSCE